MPTEPDPDLLIPATPELLTDWCGPGVLVTPRGPERVTIDGEGGVYLLNGSWVDYHALYLPALFGEDMDHLGELHLDLSRAEVRDRVARVIADRVGLLRMGAKPICTAPDWTTRFDLPHWTMAGPQFGNGGGGSSLTWIPSAGCCPSLADLNPSDDTRLPDGSRRVDAVALGRVWLEVCGGK